jgi:hypothetical protein
VAQDCIVTIVDCGTNNGLTIRPVMNGSDIVDPLFERILGRVLAEDLVDMKTWQCFGGSWSDGHLRSMRRRSRHPGLIRH